MIIILKRKKFENLRLTPSKVPYTKNIPLSSNTFKNEIKSKLKFKF